MRCKRCSIRTEWRVVEGNLVYGVTRAQVRKRAGPFGRVRVRPIKEDAPQPSTGHSCCWITRLPGNSGRIFSRARG